MKECFLYELYAVTSHDLAIGRQTLIPFGAYSLLPNLGGYPTLIHANEWSLSPPYIILFTR